VRSYCRMHPEAKVADAVERLIGLIVLGLPIK
jgi:hypothetical protein